MYKMIQRFWVSALPLKTQGSAGQKVVLLRLAQCGVPFKRADAQVLEGDPQQAVGHPVSLEKSHAVFNLSTECHVSSCF